MCILPAVGTAPPVVRLPSLSLLQHVFVSWRSKFWFVSIFSALLLLWQPTQYGSFWLVYDKLDLNVSEKPSTSEIHVRPTLNAAIFLTSFETALRMCYQYKFEYKDCDLLTSWYIGRQEQISVCFAGRISLRQIYKWLVGISVYFSEERTGHTRSCGSPISTC
jgi:hypothetical protein